MGLIKEYVDKAIQTETEITRSLYADPAVVLVAPPLPCRGFAGPPNSPPSPTVSDNPRSAPKSPASPILSPLISRRISRRKHVNRRIVSMPENKGDASSFLSQCHGKRVVSMPDRVRPALEPSAELFQSTSTVAGESFASYSGRRERVRVFRTPSDVPQTPSPPSSPESLLIIAAGTQLPEGFLRRKYSPEPLIEEDEDWITWASSPPRPIPALHGPLSLPYARCPSGAEGTIIEEPENVAQMIWGLGSDDQPHNPIRAEGFNSHLDNPQNAPSQGSSMAPPRLQKKRSTTQQALKLTRTHGNSHTSHAKQSVARTQRKVHDDKNSSLNQASLDVETHQDIPTGLAWNDGLSIPSSIGVPDNLMNDADLFSTDSNRLLEWQFARLRQALRTSLADMDYNTYPGRLEPVIPPAVAPGLSQAYPRIFVEPRPNELAGSVARQTSVEIAQQYRQQQLYRQALQKQKLQVQNILPTPPNSSSPQWSSHFSPYLTYCSTFSPELVGSTEHPIPVPSQKYRSGVNASQYLRHVYDRQEHDIAGNFDTSTNISSAKTPQTVPNVNSAASVRQSSSSANTLAKYIKQLQALSPIAHLSPLQPAPPPPNVPLPPLPSTDERAVDTLRNVYPTPPSPESPQITSRGLYHNARSMAPTRPMQRRLSSLPEEDSVLLELSTSVSSHTLQSEVTIDNASSSHHGTMGHQMHYLEKPFTSIARKSDICLPELDSNLGTSVAFYDSPVKVRLPATRGNNVREQADEHEPNKEGRQYGNRRKHRYKKVKGTTAANEQETTHRLAG